MKKTIRYIIVTGILLFASLSQGVRIQAAPQEIQIELNHSLQYGINPIVEKDTTLVPLRGVGDLLGASVNWDAPTKTITIVQDKVINTLQLNQTTAHKEDENGRTEIQLSLPPITRGGTTYVPLRYIAESLDVKVGWDQQTKRVKMYESLQYNNKKVFLGEPTGEIISLLGKPSFTMADEVCDYLFYVDDYRNVMILYSADDVVAGWATNAETMRFREIAYKGKGNHNISGLTTIQDSHDGDKIVALGCNMQSTDASTKASLLANERIIFELTNGFRAHNNIRPLKYNDKLSDVARRHSQDMAGKNYFSHTSLDGTAMSERISRSGINWSSCGENIAAGNRTGFAAFGQWLNSLGHRENMLSQTGDLGVGSAYDGNSTYGYYHTQNFAHIR